MSKQALTQRSFTLGQPREEFLEAADIDLGDNSLRLAENVRIKATRTIAQRLGTEYIKNYPGSDYLQEPIVISEIRPADGLVYVVFVTSQAVEVLDSNGTFVWGTVLPAPGDPTVWVETFGNQIVIGSRYFLQMLTYANGTFSLNDFAFDVAPGGELAQPYWSFVGGITLTPSALTGSITVTASANLFSAQWVGMRIRYAYREILITAYTNATTVTGTVVSELPPTYRLTMSAVTGFRVNDIVQGQTTGFEGIVVAVDTVNKRIDVVTLKYFDGPDTNEVIASPNSTSSASASGGGKASSSPGGSGGGGGGSSTGKSVISPAACPIWDEPLISPVRGYPRSGAAAAGRLFLCDFHSAPDTIAASSVRDITDFKVGDEDDDAIARAIGDNRPRLLHVINAGDVLILSSRGCYLISLRDGNALTPASFNPIKFDTRGSAVARPAVVDDGVVFIEASGTAIAAATLSGNIYLKWSVRTISTYHDQLFTNPVSLCGPPSNCTFEDKYLFVINSDGTAVAMSWVDGFDVEKIGFVPWTTDGDIRRIAPAFGTYWLSVRRQLASGLRFCVERFSSDAIMDCTLPAGGAIPTVFNGTSMSIAGDGWYSGEVTIASGAVPDVGEYPADAEIGFNFVSRVMPWPKKQVQHPKAGLLSCRVIRVSASVLKSGPFQIRCNAITQNFGGYSFGDDLSLPAPERTQIFRASVVGRRDHPEIEFIKPHPAKFQILAISQEVGY